MAAAAIPKKAVPRKDPRPRSHDGASKGTGLINARPDMKYVGAARGTGAVEEYLNRGYEVVIAEEGGPRFSRKTSKLGDPIEYNGHVLMCISRESADWIDQYGEDGESGWAEADKIEAHIIDKRGMQKDLMRGLHGNYVKYDQEIGSPEPTV